MLFFELAICGLPVFVRLLPFGFIKWLIELSKTKGCSFRMNI